MTDFLAKLTAGLNACQTDGGRILLAVSGGPDSVALLHGMHALRTARGMTLFAAHVNHGLRGSQSDADAQWLADLAHLLDVPLAVHSVNVAEIAAQRGTGLEETAPATFATGSSATRRYVIIVRLSPLLTRPTIRLRRSCIT